MQVYYYRTFYIPFLHPHPLTEFFSSAICPLTVKIKNYASGGGKYKHSVPETHIAFSATFYLNT
jgi:hypothetical protein